MPNVQPLKKDTYLCSSHRLPHPEKKQYIVEIEPHASEATAHHMLLFGCRLPFQSGSWNCGDMGGGVCLRGSRILFGWAKNAQGIEMPSGVGFAVGGDTEIKYIVLQIHYGHVDVFQKGATDDSGLTLHLTDMSMPNIASIYLLYANRAHIVAHSAMTKVDIACKYYGAEMHPFAFRVHAHNLGKRIMAYRVRDNHWTKIAVGSPQNPQAFYPLDHAPVIEEGDIIAARCEFDASSRDGDTGIGSHGSDEMCNFYMMYYSAADAIAYNSRHECGGDGSAIWRNFHEPDSVEYDDQVLSTRIPPAIEETEQNTMYTNELVPSSTMPSETVVEWHTPEEMVEVDSDDTHNNTHDGTNTEANSPTEFIDSFSTEESQSDFQTHLVMQQWPVGKNGSGIVISSSGFVGQVSGVDVNGSGIVFIFHRGPRVWDYYTFDYKNIYQRKSEGPIAVPTVLALDSESGIVVQEWGQHVFYMPHGLTVDSQGNLWLTDVALHQVFKFPANGGSRPLLELGEAFVPGSDHQHFCKPADVAVLSTGAFFVADGYCNKRIIRFHSDGQYDTEWTAEGTSNLDVSLFGRQYFDIPHSLTISEQYTAVCVADRENGRVLCYRYDSGTFITQFDKVFV
jgi:peptidylamidoglycolate lyase